jgi:hypothetical protein
MSTRSLDELKIMAECGYLGTEEAREWASREFERGRRIGVRQGEDMRRLKMIFLLFVGTLNGFVWASVINWKALFEWMMS